MKIKNQFVEVLKPSRRIMDLLLVGFVVFDIIILFLIFRFMAKKVERKIELVEKRQRSKWEKDEGKLRAVFATEEE